MITMKSLVCMIIQNKIKNFAVNKISLKDQIYNWQITKTIKIHKYLYIHQSYRLGSAAVTTKPQKSHCLIIKVYFSPMLCYVLYSGSAMPYLLLLSGLRLLKQSLSETFLLSRHKEKLKHMLNVKTLVTCIGQSKPGVTGLGSVIFSKRGSKCLIRTISYIFSNFLFQKLFKYFI